MAKLIKGVNDLATLRPDLAAEWNYEKNGNLKPEDVTCGSGKKVWWRCSLNHEWEAAIYSRIQGRSCPYCSGQRVLSGFNDLASQRPDLASKWHPIKNGELTPEDVTCGTPRKVWWQCEKGHEWEATINSRTKGNGCPYCAGHLPIKGETDLASQNPFLAAEWHPTKNGNLTPEDVTCGSSRMVWWQCENGHEWKCAINKRTNNQGCPYCSGHRALYGFNDLASQRPDLAVEWHPTKNGNLTPKDVTCGSDRKVWWKCAKGHEWESAINSRARRSRGCPYCSNQRVLYGFNDLASQRPDLAVEWHPTKNGDLTPKDVTCGSEQKAWWKCSKGHEWEARIANRIRLDSGCPYCSGRLPIKGKSDLASQRSDLISEWHPTKNGNLRPEDVTVYSSRKVWWRCEKGHEWESIINNRTGRGRGCPHCASSHGEETIAKILDLLDISYLHDKSLDGCCDKGLLRHDFILLSENRVIATIEFHGQQHYEPVSFGGSEEEAQKNFEDGQRRDAIKTAWLKEHGIPQLIIPYWDFDNIEQIIKDFLDSEEVTKSKKSLHPIYIK